MEMNWQMAAFALGAIQLVGTGIIFLIIKFNDLHHLHEAVVDIKKHLDKQDTKLSSFELSLTDLKARFQERTKILKRKVR